MSLPKTNGTRWRRWLPVILGGVAVLAVAGTMVLSRAASLAGTATTVPTFTVQRGPLTISVVESGTIKSQDQVVLKSEVEGQTTLIFLIPEGTRVQEGELLAELDASKLRDDRVERQIQVDNAQAAYIQASENLSIVKNQTAGDISKAELAAEFAVQDLKKYMEGEYQQQHREATSKITIANEELNRAKDKMDWSKRLCDEKYLSGTEYEADRLTYERARLDYELALAAKDLLEQYTHERQRRQLESDVEQTKLALDRTRLKGNADIVQAEAQLKAKEAEFRQQQVKLAKIDELIEKSKIIAPRAGLVVYATSSRQSRPGMTQPLEEGQTVRERQELIYLPSTDAMMAELMIHESSLGKVQPGQPVQVTVDALAGKSFAGRVRSIAPLPDAQSMFMNADRKVYATRVDLLGANPELRTGMSCRAEIIVQTFEDAFYIPVQAVIREAGKPTVYVRSGNQFVPREVDAGLDNSSMIHIASGLTAGEVVSLAPPLGASAAPFAAALPAAALPPANGANGQSGALTGVPGSQPSFVPTADPSGEVPAAEGQPRGRGRRGGDQPSGERSAELRRRMENMTPEEREEFMQRMRERRSGRQTGEEGGAPPSEPAGDQPAGRPGGPPGEPPGGSEQRS